MECTIPPPGWFCTREQGHDGPCAAWPLDPKDLPGNDPVIVGSEVISEPGAGIKVTRIKLSKKAQDALNVGKARIPKSLESIIEEAANRFDSRDKNRASIEARKELDSYINPEDIGISAAALNTAKAWINNSTNSQVDPVISLAIELDRFKNKAIEEFTTSLLKLNIKHTQIVDEKQKEIDSLRDELYNRNVDIEIMRSSFFELEDKFEAIRERTLEKAIMACTEDDGVMGTYKRTGQECAEAIRNLKGK